MGADPSALLDRLKRAWSAETSGRWSPENAARGQCSVTALAVQRLCGGEIEKTLTADGPHFYNRVGGRRYDLTASQFERPPAYADLASDAGEAMADTSPEQLDALLRGLEQEA